MSLSKYSSPIQERNTISDNFHLDSIGAPRLLRKFTHVSVLLIFFKLQGFQVQNAITVTCHYRNVIIRVLFSGVVLLSLFVVGLQNSRKHRVQCTLSAILTCIDLPGGVNFLSVYIRIYWCNAGTCPVCCSFLHFPNGLWYFSHYRLFIS